MLNFIDAKFGRMGNRMFQLAYIYAQFRDGAIPDIYLQNYEYFDRYKDEIKELFKQEGELLNYISVHVRRGKNPSVPNEPSYSENPFYVDLTILTDVGYDAGLLQPVCECGEGYSFHEKGEASCEKTNPKNYYQRAMLDFHRKGERKFLVFSDDIEWCKESLLFSNDNAMGWEFEFSPSLSELDDFNKMARCKGHIIANSSYSFMAAYVGGGPTVAPSKWFSNETRINYPEDWIVV